MKNFTNNFKQFTSRLSARWLIMALMLLLGTGSAWARNYDGTEKLYFKMDAVSWWNCGTDGNQNFAYFFNGSNNAWSGHAIKQENNIYYVVVPKGDWTTVILTRNRVTSSPSFDNKYNQTDNITIDASKNYIESFSENSTSATWSTYTPPCTPSAALSYAVYDAVNNEIDLSGSIAPCGKTLFYGFLWKEKKSDWVADNAHAISGTGGSNNKTAEDKDFAQSWNGFTPSTTYEFTAYALDATTNPYTWYYSTDENNVIEVSTCKSTTLTWDNEANIKTSMVIGESQTVSVTLDPSGAGTPTFTTTNSSVISISGTGNSITLEAKKSGSATITASFAEANGYCGSSIKKTITVTDPCATTYYLKHSGWAANGTDWGWKQLECNNGTYTLIAKYNESGCNYNTSESDTNAGWIEQSKLTLSGSPKKGEDCLFTFDPVGKRITIKALNKAGFWDLDAWNILYYSGVGYEGWIEGEDNGKVGANATIDLGEFRGTPYLNGFITNIWKKKDVSDVCEVKMTFTDGNGVTQTVSSLNEDLKFEWQDIDDDPNDSEIKQEVKSYGFSYPLPNTEGKHTVTFTFTAVINNNGTGNCTETTTMTGTIKYTIPECSVPDGITIKYADGEKFCANSNVTLSPSVEHVDGYKYAWVVSGTGWSINSGSVARECEVKVGTGEGIVKLTVSNATCSKDATTLDITPKPSTTIATPTISATKQIICNGNNDSFLSVSGLTPGATYTLVFEGSEQADPAPIPYTGSESVKFAISKAGSYTVVAKTTNTEACQFTARATNEIDFTSISFSQSVYTTTPWVPVSVVVNAPEGTTYEYDDTAITGTTVLKDAPIKTVSNNTYTYKLPRPTAWGEGNKTPANEDVDFKVSAKITVDAETCDIQSTVKLQDEGNDKCRTNP